MDASNFIKQKLERSSGIAFMRPMLIAARVLGIQGCFDLRDGRRRANVFQNFYNLVVLFVIIIMCSWSLHGRVNYTYPLMQLKSVRVIDFANMVVVLMFNVVSILLLTFWHAENLEKLLQLFLQADKDLNIGPETCVQTYFYADNILILFSTILVFICDGFVWSYAFTWDAFKYYLFRDIQYLEMVIVLLNFYNYVLCLKNRFRRINYHIVDLFSNKKVLLRKIVVAQVEEKWMNLTLGTPSDLRSISKIYDLLCDIVEIVNQIFGLQILLIVATIVASTIQTLTISLSFALGTQRDLWQEQQGTLGDNAVQIIFLNVAWSTILVVRSDFALRNPVWVPSDGVYGVILSAACSATVSNAEECSKLSHKLLLELPITSFSHQQQELREELFLLSRHVHHRKPCFTAAGFFQINFTMLFTIGGAVSSYLIVMLQLN